MRTSHSPAQGREATVELRVADGGWRRPISSFDTPTDSALDVGVPGDGRSASRRPTVVPPAERIRWARIVSAVCGLAVVVIGTGVLAGWVFGVERLKSPSPGLVSVKANAALAFVLSGLSLVVLRTGSRSRRSAVVLAALAAAAVAAIALVTLAEYVFGGGAIDQLLFHDSPRAIETISPGRMSMPTALALAFGSAALALRVAGPPIAQQLAAAAVLVIGSSTVLAYIYGVALSRPEGTTAIAASSAVTILLMGIGLILSDPGHGPIATLLQDEPGGVMARWLLGTGIVLLPLLGGLRLLAQRAGLYSSSVGVGIMVVVSLIALGSAVALTANRLNLLGRDRTLTLHRLRRSEGRLRKTLEHLLQVEEEERRELAMDLHDDALPALAAVSFQLELAASRATGSEVGDRLDRAGRELRQATFRLRHLTFDLLPEALANEGIAGALRHRLERMQAFEGLEYDLQDRAGTAIPIEHAVILYRIALEALRNVVRHAKATRVRVKLEHVDRLARVTISDDGVGFAPPQDGRKHLGLLMMKQRAELAGGRFDIRPSPEGGTTIMCEVPLDPLGGEVAPDEGSPDYSSSPPRIA